MILPGRDPTHVASNASNASNAIHLGHLAAATLRLAAPPTLRS